MAKSGVSAPVILPCQNNVPGTNEGPVKGHKLCKMPNQSISEAECKRLAQVLEPKALPDACKEYALKTEAKSSAWSGATHLQKRTSKHAQLQRRLTSTAR
mmetsp:Transcript_17278/g.45414  ORF Transcript_17278/g.45414 Transcript_17278/m.45414 type:complete len:100 (+) Transcript_17278:105-404(+)